MLGRPRESTGGGCGWRQRKRSIPCSVPVLLGEVLAETQAGCEEQRSGPQTRVSASCMSSHVWRWGGKRFL